MINLTIRVKELEVKPVLAPPDISALIDDLLYADNDERRAAARENILEAFDYLQQKQRA